MKSRLRTQVIVLWVGMLLSGCGDSVTANPNYNWKGTAGNLMVSEVSAQDKNGSIERFPVGFNSAATWADMMTLLNNSPGTIIIGGVVVPSSESPSGFYFDPNTTTYTTGGAPEWVTTVDQVKADPKKFATTKADSGFPTGFWYVTLQVDQINP